MRSPPAILPHRLAPWLFLVLLAVPGSSAVALFEYRGDSAIAPRLTPTPLVAASVSAGAGTCLTTETASVPSVTGPSSGSIGVTEPATCPTGTRLVFLPALSFSNALSVSAGHVLTGAVTIAGISGSTAMGRSLHVYLQSMTLAHPIVTGTHARVANGVITVATSSTATLGTASAYGIGLRVTLTRPAVASTANLVLELHFALHDGGVDRAVFEEQVTLALTY